MSIMMVCHLELHRSPFLTNRGPRALSAMNFSHVFKELSFGRYYPGLANPLDGVTEYADSRGFGSFGSFPADGRNG